MIRLWLYGILTALVLGGAWYGYHSITTAFSERDALRAQVKQQKADLAAQVEATRDALNQAAENASKYETERKLREAITHKANAREQQTNEDLTHAKRELARWRAAASPTLAKCLDVIVPDGAVGLPDGPAKASTAADGGAGTHP